MSRKIDFARQPDYIKQMAHCIGLDYKRPSLRHGGLIYRPYKNYCDVILPDEVWAGIEYNGWAAHDCVKEQNGISTCRYYLTCKGRKHLGDVLGVTIYDYKLLQKQSKNKVSTH